MSIIVEDGTGKSDAQCYCTVEYADAWHLARGVTLWATMSTPEKEACIVRAAGYMQQAYRLRWLGSRNSSTQALDWPRLGVSRVDGPGFYGADPSWYGNNVVPIEVQQANAELAFKAAFGDLSADVERLTKREKVDVIEVEYAEGASPSTRYRSADQLLAPLLRDRGGSVISVSRG